MVCAPDMALGRLMRLTRWIWLLLSASALSGLTLQYDPVYSCFKGRAELPDFEELPTHLGHFAGGRLPEQGSNVAASHSLFLQTILGRWAPTRCDGTRVLGSRSFDWINVRFRASVGGGTPVHVPMGRDANVSLGHDRLMGEFRCRSWAIPPWSSPAGKH